LFEFFGVLAIEGYPQAREIPVTLLVETLSILDPDNTFDPKTLTGESNPETYDPNTSVVVTCSGEAFLFRKVFPQRNLI
jgi:hypothetical protein